MPSKSNKGPARVTGPELSVKIDGHEQSRAVTEAAAATAHVEFVSNGHEPEPIPEVFDGPTVEIAGVSYPMRARHLSFQDRLTWSPLANEFDRLQKAMSKFDGASRAIVEDDDWAEPVVPEPELVRAYARIHKRVCRFAYPTVPIEVWRSINDDDDQIVALAEKFLTALMTAPEGNATSRA